MSELRLDFDNLPAPVALSVARSPLGDVRVSIGLNRADDVTPYARALGCDISTASQPYIPGLLMRTSSVTAQSPGLVVHVVGAQVESELPPLVNGTYFADDAPDPDLAAADAVWHREHPADRCPNAATCGECRTGVA